jgi:hypothetical protein
MQAKKNASESKTQNAPTVSRHQPPAPEVKGPTKIQTSVPESTRRHPKSAKGL